MSADRELLEMAAKAAGVKGFFVERSPQDGYPCYTFGITSGMQLVLWNSLGSNGDALCLVRDLSMTLAWEPSRGGWSVGAIVDGEFAWLSFDVDQLRAITLAAAIIGRAMP